MIEHLKNDSLEERLRQDAAAQTPAFSQSLHRRVMDAAAAQGDHVLQLKPPTARRPWMMAAAAAVVAGSMLAVYFAGGPSSSPGGSAGNRQVAGGLALPTPAELMHQTTAPVLQGLEDLNRQTYAAMDADARNLARFMAGRLDFMPASRAVQ